MAAFSGKDHLLDNLRFRVKDLYLEEGLENGHKFLTDVT